MRERIDYIDFAKGFLMFLVILGHCINGENYLKNIIYAFHMPAFFIISGILFHYSLSIGKNFGKFLLSRIRQLFIPYIMFEFLGYIVQCFTKGSYENLNGFIFRVITFQVHTDVDWFLIALFFGELLFYFTKKNKYVGIVTTVFSFVLAYFVPIKTLKWILAAVMYLNMGYLWDGFFQKSRKWVILCAYVSILISAYFNIRVDINNGVFGNPWLYLFGAVGGTYLLLEICQGKLLFSLTDIWKFFGEASLIVMGTHTLIIQILWNKIFIGWIPDWIASCCLCLIVMICEGIIIWVYNKLKLAGVRILIEMKKCLHN